MKDCSNEIKRYVGSKKYSKTKCEMPSNSQMSYVIVTRFKINQDDVGICLYLQCHCQLILIRLNEFSASLVKIEKNFHEARLSTNLAALQLQYTFGYTPHYIQHIGD